MKRSEIRFEKGAILRKEMLEEMYAYPRVLMETYFHKYSDGILYGLEWKENLHGDGKHTILPGALKYHGKLYFLEQPIEVEAEIGEVLEPDYEYRLCFVEGEKVSENFSQDVYEMKFEALKEGKFYEKKENLFYYAKVRCFGARKLKMVFDEAFGLWAAEDGYSFKLSPDLVNRNIVKIVEEKKEKHFLDFLFLSESLKEKGIPLSFVKQYINEAGLEVREEDYSEPFLIMECFKKAISKLKMAVPVRESFEEETSLEKQAGINEGGLL